jgi:purine-binding chemotaxis protein CheW
MGGAVSKAPQPDARATRADLVAQLRRLEGEIQKVQGRLMSLGGQTLPGIHLVIEAAGRRALISAARVVEIVRMVATTPLAGAPPNVIGTFICRGAPVLAYDLRRLLGAKDEPGIDAQIVILAGTPTVGLVVDRVPRLVEDPKLFEGDVVAGLPEGWRDSRLAAGLCLDGEDALPVLDLSPIQAELVGRIA